MTITIFTDHANELIRVDDVLDGGGSAVVALGLVNQDGSDTFPGRSLTADRAEELAAGLAQAAAAARAAAGLAATPLGGEQAHGDTLRAIRAAARLTSARSFSGEGEDEQAEASASPAAAPKDAMAVSRATPKVATEAESKAISNAATGAAPKAAPSGPPKPAAKPRGSGKRTSSGA